MLFVHHTTDKEEHRERRTAMLAEGGWECDAPNSHSKGLSTQITFVNVVRRIAQDPTQAELFQRMLDFAKVWASEGGSKASWC